MSRIVNGENAPEPIPWQVSLWKKGKFFCGGTILDEKTILTARHCILFGNLTGHFDRTLVMAGSTNKYGGGISVPVDRFVLLTDIMFDQYGTIYGGKGKDYDLAILKLSTPLTFSDHIKPICLPTEDLIIPFGMECIISGFGDIDRPGIPYIPYIKSLEIKISLV